MEYFFMDKVTAKRLICLGTQDILYLKLSAFLVDNRDFHKYICLCTIMYTVPYRYGTGTVQVQCCTVPHRTLP